MVTCRPPVRDLIYSVEITMTDDSTVLTLGDVARRLGCRPWQVRRLYERGLLPEPTRVGTYRVVHHRDLAAVTAALRDAGYLPAAATAAPAT